MMGRVNDCFTVQSDHSLALGGRDHLDSPNSVLATP